MEDAGRLPRVLPQRAEERRLEARVDAAQDREMQLEIVFLAVEDPTEILADAAGDVLDGDVDVCVMYAS